MDRGRYGQVWKTNIVTLASSSPGVPDLAEKVAAARGQEAAESKES